jgi:hypothetical protein
MSGHAAPPDDYTNIAVVCDSARHARGKIAKIVIFCYLDGRWQRTSHNVRMRQMRRRGDKLKARGIKPSDLSGLQVWGPRDVGLRCKLCGLHTPEPSDAVLNRLAAQGRSSVTLTDLRSASI